MNPIALVERFHAEVARDLGIFMAVLALAAAAAWLAALLVRERWLLAAALTMTLAGGGLAYAAHSYRAGIPVKMEEDKVLVRQDPAAAASRFIARHGAAQTWPHFLRLTLIWGTIALVAGLAMLLLRRAPVQGIGLGLILLCGITWTLDVAAYRRDVAYAAAWEARQAGLPPRP